MSKTYTGLCIGGPLDGRHASSESSVLKAHWPLAVPPAPILVEAIPATIVVDRFEYRHVAFHFRNTDRPGWEGMRGFWTPAHVEDQLLYVLDALAKAYQERANG